MPDRFPVTVRRAPFVATAAAAIAQAVDPAMLDHCIFALFAGEAAHNRALSRMERPALLNLSLNIGEGAGAALAASMCRAALNIHLNMARRADESDPVLPN